MNTICCIYLSEKFRASNEVVSDVLMALSESRKSRATVVDDVGVALNPMMVKGHEHGGVVQGAGQILLEQVVYVPESGQLLTGSFMDYAMPRADNFPSFNVIEHNVPSKNNPMGLKGAGEAGTVGALPAVMNAICDALRPLGIRHMDMPATPERVWQVIQTATQNTV